MGPGDKQRKMVGVYDRPAGADRKPPPWLWVVLVLLIALAAIAWFAYRG